jgi:hypothetical protein
MQPGVAQEDFVRTSVIEIHGQSVILNNSEARGSNREGRMNRTIFALFAAAALSCNAQTKPAGACSFDSFDAAFTPHPRIATVTTKASVLTWLACDSPKGCVSLPIEAGSPVLIYNVQDRWTCGYTADSHGGGAVWFRSADLRLVSYARDSPLTAWLGGWTGGQDRVRIDLSKAGGSLHLQGKATWHGEEGIEHYGNIEGDTLPEGNHLHLSPNSPAGCTVDLVLFRKFILARDNGLCGDMNARFWGFWRQTASGQQDSEAN